MRMNHCSEISGSIRSPERCENGHRRACRAPVRVIRPSLAQRGDDGLARLQRGQAGEALAGLASVMRPSSPITRDLLEPVRAADLEVVRVVARA